MTRLTSPYAAWIAISSLTYRFAHSFVYPNPTAVTLSRNLPNDRLKSSNMSKSLYLFNSELSLNDLSHVFTHTSTFIATIDSDIASIPDNEFRKVFAGGAFIMLGSLLSTIFVGFMVEKSDLYADLVAETYAGQYLNDEEETFLDSLKLTPGEKKATEDMVRTFREKKMKKAGTWTEEDELNKQRLTEEKDMFSDYD